MPKPWAILYKSTCPEATFIIGLVDDFHPDVDFSSFDPFEIIKYDQIGFDCFEDMLSKYNIIEFNTAVKPFYINYLFNRYGAGTKVYYIDPDIKLYSGINTLNVLLDNNDILLTPNLTEMPDEVDSGELASLRHGLFNLGFIGVKCNDEGVRFVEWWKKRLRHHCLINKSNGLFVDQKWVDIAVLYFKGLHIAGHKGLNMAWWNLSERKLIEFERKYYVNTTSEELIFFHFSGYIPGSNTITGRNQDALEYTFMKRPELINIFNEYTKDIIANDYVKLSALKPLLHFGSAKKVANKTFSQRLLAKIKLLLK